MWPSILSLPNSNSPALVTIWSTHQEYWPVGFRQTPPCTPPRSVLESSVNAINRGRIAGFPLRHESSFDWISGSITENSVGDSDSIFHVSLSRDSTISPENFICRW